MATATALTTDARLVGTTAGKVLRAFDRTMTVDRLLTRPRDAMEVCRLTNLRLNRQLPHELIEQDEVAVLAQVEPRGQLGLDLVEVDVELHSALHVMAGVIGHLVVLGQQVHGTVRGLGRFPPVR